MKTVKQSICVDFKAVELEDAMKVAPLMDTLNRSLSEKETCTIQMPREMVCNVLKTLSDFGFRMSDGSYYKELPEEMNSPSPSKPGKDTLETLKYLKALRDAGLIYKGSELVFVFSYNPLARLEIIKTIKDYLGIGLKEAKEAFDTKKITLPHDILKETFNKMCIELKSHGIDCYFTK